MLQSTGTSWTGKAECLALPLTPHPAAAGAVTHLHLASNWIASGLLARALRACEHGAGGDAPEPLLRRTAACVFRLCAEAGSGSQREDLQAELTTLSLYPPTHRAQRLHSILERAAPVAAAFLARQQQPEQQAALQLEAGQAAAVRGCAYLRCANVGSGGELVAGRATGSRKCSACRTVW
jgi:hypothetical protein